MRIEATPLPRALHVRAVNDSHHPAQLYFKGPHLWRLTLVDSDGQVRTFQLDDPVRRLYWSRYLEPGQSYEATFAGLPSGTYDARVDFLAQWCEPLFLKGISI